MTPINLPPTFEEKLHAQMRAEVRATRVLQCHVDAVAEAFPHAARILNERGAEGWRDACELLAGVVLSAGDSTTRYCIACRTPSGYVAIYGPYQTADSAEKAIEGGHIGYEAGSRVGIWPLIPSPKGPAPKAVGPKKPRKKSPTGTGGADQEGNES